MSLLDNRVDPEAVERVWGKYPNYDDIARFGLPLGPYAQQHLLASARS